MEFPDDPGMGTLPTLLANTNHACYKCGAYRSRETRLQRCGGCKRVSYCGLGKSPSFTWGVVIYHLPECQDVSRT